MLSRIKRIKKEVSGCRRAIYGYISSFWQKIAAGSLLITFFPKVDDVASYSSTIFLISSFSGVVFLVLSLREDK